MALHVDRMKSSKFNSELRNSSLLAWSPFVARLSPVIAKQQDLIKGNGVSKFIFGLH